VQEEKPSKGEKLLGQSWFTGAKRGMERLAVVIGLNGAGFLGGGGGGGCEGKKSQTVHARKKKKNTMSKWHRREQVKR